MTVKTTLKIALAATTALGLALPVAAQEASFSIAVRWRSTVGSVSGGGAKAAGTAWTGGRPAPRWQVRHGSSRIDTVRPTSWWRSERATRPRVS